MTAPDWPATGRVVHLDVDDTPLAVRTWGQETGRPLFFWHPLGTVTSGAWLTELAPVLTADFGLRLVAVDGPGFGDSPPLPSDEYDVARLSAIAWGAIDQLGLDRPVLMGHSWGGLVVTHAAGARAADVSALVLLDSGHLAYADLPGTEPDQSLPDRIAALEALDAPLNTRAALHEELAHDLRRPVTDLLLAALEPAMRDQPDGSVELVATARTRAAARHGMLHARPSESWPPIAAARIPVLLLLATEPATTRDLNEAGLGQVTAALPELDARFLAGWGHDLIGDGGPDLARVIGDWLRAAGR